eukprot:TRINITY_DN37039_c0_g1_i1.p1 TRINITY_DN37039_c0_g1~~TRINITY_DN37039_c0_g1_i1.p1  ORF type:complete len:756 (-),score=117.27 TRINITY_DN37039_c0_g1_i1:182-2419(-)
MPYDGPFAEEVLRALEVEHALGASRQTDQSRGEVRTTLATSRHFKQQLEHFRARISTFESWKLAAVVCELGEAVEKLRAWYTVGVGDLLMCLLERVALQPHQLPWTDAAKSHGPGLSLLKLVEGVILILTALHARSNVASLLEKLLLSRRLLPSCFVRLEAVVVCLDGDADADRPRDGCVATSSSLRCQPRPGVPPEIKINAVYPEMEDRLASRAKDIMLDPAVKRQMFAARDVLVGILDRIFPAGTADLFGGCVNGFETSSSDVDCVVSLPEEKVKELATRRMSERADASEKCASRRKRAAAAAAVCILADTMRHEMSSANAGIKLHVKEVVVDSRVPLVKCETSGGIALDVSFNNVLPYHNTRLLRAYTQLDQRVGKLGRIVKHWAKCRRINDAWDGTLSSYSYILLVIHYLQRVGLVPNLQDKSLVSAERRNAYGQEDLVDGLHDVWFMDPSKTLQGMPELGAWKASAPKDATLFGLLAGFFRYYAYQFPIYSEVISIRLPGGRLSKLAYFEVDSGIARGGIGRSQLDEDGVLDEPALDVMTGLTGCSGNLEREKETRLSAVERTKQRRITMRQTMCIDDPMERGRVLGTSFQGMERLSCEMRRACALLATAEHGSVEHVLDKLFQSCPTPPRCVAKLVEQVQLPSVLNNPSSLGVQAFRRDTQSAGFASASSIVADSMRKWHPYRSDDDRGQWWWHEEDGSWFGEWDPGEWSKYVDPKTEQAYWYKNDLECFWEKTGRKLQ